MMNKNLFPAMIWPFQNWTPLISKEGRTTWFFNEREGLSSELAISNLLQRFPVWNLHSSYNWMKSKRFFWIGVITISYYKSILLKQQASIILFYIHILPMSMSGISCHWKKVLKTQFLAEFKNSILLKKTLKTV